MYPNNSMVTLSVDKHHGEGENRVSLKSGVCGLVMRSDKKTDNNHLYTVDFGAYGAWYCYHNELSGEDSEGWDVATIPYVLSVTERAAIEPPLLHIEVPPEGSPVGFGVVSPQVLPTWEGFGFDFIDEEDVSEEDKKEAGFVKIDLEADIRKRMEAIERGE